MKLIKLTNGLFALVDDEDFEWLNKFKWHSTTLLRKNKYAVRDIIINGKKSQIKMHRQILGLTDPKIFADHKNHNTLDNQKSNLRKCTVRENFKNVQSHADSNSKYLGVGFRPNRGKYRARIWDGQKEICLGHFKDEKDAALAYNEAAKIHHGEFANLNII